VFRKEKVDRGWKDWRTGIKYAIMRHIWNLYAKARSLWVALRKEYLDSENPSVVFMELEKNSWNLRAIAWSFIQFKVGYGSDVHLWLDRWHPNRILYEKFGYRVVHDAGSRVEDKLATVLKDKTWCWQPAQWDNLVCIQSNIREVDQLVWNISKKKPGKLFR